MTTVEKLQNIHKTLEAQRNQIRPPWIKTSRADSIFGVVIMLNAAFIGVELEFNTGGGLNWGFWICETIFLVIFCVELALRFKAANPKREFFDAWGIFDTFVTLSGCIDAWMLTFIFASADGEGSPLSSLVILRVLRLVRLVRLLRVLRMFSELVILVNTILSSIKAVTWMSVLLGLIIYIGSILTVMLIGVPLRESDADVEEFFGSLGAALFSHFAIVTLEGWVDVAAAAMKHNKLWAIYFAFVIILTNFCLVNLMIGVIVERIIRVAQEQEAEIASFVSESEQFKVTLRTLFDCADIDGSGEVTREEVRDLLNDTRTHDIMSAFGINVKMPPGVLHTIMDLNYDGPTTFDEFFENCIRLSGSKGNVHSVFVQHDICACHQELKKKLRSVEERLTQVSSGMQALPMNMVSAPLSPQGAAKINAPPSPHGTLQAAAPPAPYGSPVPPPLQIPLKQEKMSPSPSPRKLQEAAANNAEVQATVRQIMERMEQFSFVQQHIMAELYALKEHQKMASSGQAAKPGLASVPLASRDPLGCCAVDSAYDRPTAMSSAVSGGRLGGGFCSIGQEQKANSSQIAPPAGAGGERKAGDLGAPSPRSAARIGALPYSADQVRRGFEAEFQARRGGM
eukprot:TRINITY_DN36394_c0_g1_i1.p1 TRINITY_DN36394_c0_g1~~TRINITY_DN36394_c0_g1_i1.p1  ORF type:complete len:626 (+),score=131.01 TRINITY_DN36394_c0_g1_i1:49-1926(+)